MHLIRVLSLLVSGSLLSAPLLSADTLLFRNGNRVDGSLVSVDSQTIRFNVGNHVNTYNRGEIDSIRFAGSDYAPASAPPPPAAPAPPPPAAVSSAYPPADSSSGAYPTASSNLQVPAGSEIVVRLIDRVDSETDRLGQSYRASIDQPVTVNGQTVIPRGADATATLISANQSGKIEGRTSLTLDLKSVQINGQSYDIVTTGVTQESSSRGARSAKVIGGTAAVGAIIGALAGGGKGAAIGAGSGAAVGTAAQVVTSGQKVKVPAETRLSFTLQNPLYLR